MRVVVEEVAGEAVRARGVVLRVARERRPHLRQPDRHVPDRRAHLVAAFTLDCKMLCSTSRTRDTTVSFSSRCATLPRRLFLTMFFDCRIQFPGFLVLVAHHGDLRRRLQTTRDTLHWFLASCLRVPRAALSRGNYTTCAGSACASAATTAPRRRHSSRTWARRAPWRSPARVQCRPAAAGHSVGDSISAADMTRMRRVQFCGSMQVHVCYTICCTCPQQDRTLPSYTTGTTSSLAPDLGIISTTTLCIVDLVFASQCR